MSTSLIQTSNLIGERFELLQVTQSGSSQKRVVLSVQVTNILAGDVLTFSSYGELTNNLGFNVFMAWQTILTDTDTATSGVALSKPRGFNITPDTHHGVWTDVGAYQFTQDVESIYINSYLYASASQAISSSKLTVEQGYGKLNVLLHRN